MRGPEYPLFNGLVQMADHRLGGGLSTVEREDPCHDEAAHERRRV
jgi:hypothetical protein